MNKSTNSNKEAMSLKLTTADHRLVVLVTGLRRGGIGAAICRRLTQDGHSVIVVEREEAGKDAALEISGDIMFVHGDAADETCLENLMQVIKDRYSRLDAVVANAGWA